MRSKCSRSLAAVAVCVLLAGASVACRPEVYGYFDAPYSNPLDVPAQLHEHGSYANVTMTVRPEVEADWQAAEAAGLKVIVTWPLEFFLTVDAGRPLLLSLPMWCRPDWCNQTAADWLNVIRAHQEQVAGVFVADEYDCGRPFPDWPAWACAAAAAKIEANLADVRAYLPGLPTWVNYTPAWTNWLQFADPSRYGVSLASAEWVSFDAYTRWDACFGRLSCPQLLAGLKRFMRPEQRIVLLPRAFDGSFLGWSPAPSEVSVMAWQYYRYAQEDPAVVGIVPFIWRSVSGVGTGAAFVPELRDTYTQIGMLVTGRPGPPPPAPPNGVRVVREL